MHKETHNSVKRFGCDICNKMFSQQRYLVAHKRIHSRMRPQNTGSPFVCAQLWQTVDSMTFTNDYCEQQPDQRGASSHVSHSNVMDSWGVVVKKEEGVLFVR